MESGPNTLAREKYQMLGREYSFGNIKNIEKDELESYVIAQIKKIQYTCY